ncbi:Alkaline phosphatase synthesis sensor protein PhoR [compost metagenome]
MKVWKKIWHVLNHILQLMIVILVLSASWTGATYMTRAIYQKVGTPPWNYIVQLIDVIVGVAIFILVLLLLGLFYRNRQLDILTSIIEAMRKISKGDFSVKLEDKPSVFGEYEEYKKIINSVNEMARELSRMETMRQDFISNVSHEIQSPLTSISGFASALRSSELSETQKTHYLDIIEGESRRLSQLSDNLLKLSSLEVDNISFAMNRFRLDGQIRSVVLASEPQWMNKGVQVDLELGSVEVEGSEDLLVQVWSNLLHNSIKFTPNEGTITLTLKKIGQFAVVTVADNGIGISQSDQLYIFERFYKADKSRNRNEGGSGLGLSIVKKIVDIHHGAITVSSKSGEGTVFTVRIPL